jgi:hypothetical protein
MNERILELAEQATEYANEQNELHGVGYVITFKEKFAELIVRECIDTVSDCSVEYCTRPQIVSEIKQHFGVEE